MTDTTSLGQAAYEHWAKNGHPVFPCSASKRPLTPKGFYNAVTDKEEVYKLFAEHPSARYIGVATGEVSGFFAIDFDLYKSEAAMEMHDALVSEHLLPRTRIHTTKSGGLHYLYLIPKGEEVRNGAPFEDIEIRGTGGYIIVPPSVGYEIHDNHAMIEAPVELIRKIQQGVRKFNTSSTDELESKVLDGSNFHEALVILAARKQADGETQAETQKYLLDLVKASVASHPEHSRNGRWQGLVRDDGRELTRIISSANRKFNFKSADKQLKDAYIHYEEYENDEENDESYFKKGYAMSDIMANTNDKPFVVFPLIMEGDVVLLSADPKAGKSLFAMTLALHMGAGLPLGKLLPVRENNEASKVPCVYFALEGQSAIRIRAQAWLNSMGIDPSEVNVYVVEEGIDFTSITARKYVVENLVKLEKKYREEGHGPIGLIVIDTLTKAMPGKNQNAVEDTSEVFDIVRTMRDAGLNACVLYVHHNRRDGEMPRGSSNIMAEPDTILKLKKHDDRVVDGIPATTIEVNIYMARAIDDGFTQEYALKEVNIGKNMQGIEQTSVIVRPVETKVAQAHSSDEEQITEAIRTGDMSDELLKKLGIPYRGKDEITNIFMRVILPTIVSNQSEYGYTSEKEIYDFLREDKATKKWLKTKQEKGGSWAAAMIYRINRELGEDLVFYDAEKKTFTTSLRE